MTFRSSLVLLGLGAALAIGTPTLASAESGVDMTTKTSAVNIENPKANTKDTAKGKADAKAKGKNKADKEAEVAKAESGNFFAALFRPNEKTQDEAAPGKKQLTAKERKAAEKALAKAKKNEPRLEEPVLEVVSAGNNGELRSEVKPENRDLFSALFGGNSRQQLLPETRALDAVLAAKDAGRKFKVKSEFEPQEVSFDGYKRGTIVIDTSARFLYLVESSSTARRYAIAVGREGLEFKGSATVGDKQEWPRWIPTLDMQKRDPRKYGQYKEGMPGGPENPLGARAIYLYQGKKDTHIRIHGTNQPQTIGTNSSNGCFRMVNDHVQDLYSRVKMGTEVIVM